MQLPKFETEEIRKEFWAGWHEVRGTVWNVLKAEGIDKPTLEQYFAKGEQLSEEYIARWEQTHTQTPQPPIGGESTEEVEEVVTHAPSVTEVSTKTPQPPIWGEFSPMESANLEAPEIEANEEQTHTEGEPSGTVVCLHSATWFKIIICLASIIATLFVGGWFMPFVCILPFFGVVAYEHDKMQRAMVVHDSPDLYQYGTRSC